jgi:hypothetical protein
MGGPENARAAGGIREARTQAAQHASRALRLSLRFIVLRLIASPSIGGAVAGFLPPRDVYHRLVPRPGQATRTARVKRCARTPRPVAELTGFAGGSRLPPAEGVLPTTSSQGQRRRRRRVGGPRPPAPAAPLPTATDPGRGQLHGHTPPYPVSSARLGGQSTETGLRARSGANKGGRAGTWR